MTAVWRDCGDGFWECTVSGFGCFGRARSRLKKQALVFALEALTAAVADEGEVPA